MPEELQSLLDHQSGVVSRKQALACDLTKHAWDWRLSSGRWQVVLPGVAVAHSGSLTEDQRLWAAQLYGGKGAALGGRTALGVLGASLPWKLDGHQPIEVVIPHERRLSDATLPDGGAVTIKRLRRPERWTTSCHGLKVVRAQAAVLHAVAWASSDPQAEFLLTATIQQGKTSVPRVRDALSEMPELTRRALVCEVLDDVELGAHAVSELRFLRMCRTYGVPLPDELQRRVRVGANTHYLDARYAAHRLTIEIDGAHHRDAQNWEADALRTLRVAASMPGEQVIRITTGMLRHHAAEVARLLRQLLLGRIAA